MLIERAQHDFFLDVAHDFGTDARPFCIVGGDERRRDLSFKARAVAGLFGIDPVGDRQLGAEVAFHG